MGRSAHVRHAENAAARTTANSDKSSSVMFIPLDVLMRKLEIRYGQRDADQGADGRPLYNYRKLRRRVVDLNFRERLRRTDIPELALPQFKQHLSIASHRRIWAVMFCRLRRATAFLDRCRAIGGCEADSVCKLPWIFGRHHPTYVFLCDDQGCFRIGFRGNDDRASDRQQIIKSAWNRYPGNIPAIGNYPDIRGREEFDEFGLRYRVQQGYVIEPV